MKKIISLCLSFLLAFSMFSFTAMAKETTTVASSEKLEFTNNEHGWTIGSGVTATASDGALEFSTQSTWSLEATYYNFTTVPDITQGKYYILEAKVHVPSADNINRMNLGFKIGDTVAGRFILGTSNGTTNLGKVIRGGVVGAVTEANANTLGNSAGAFATLKDGAVPTALPTSDFVTLKMVIDKAANKIEYWQNNALVDTFSYSDNYIDFASKPTSVTVFADFRVVNTNSDIGFKLDDVVLYSANDYVENFSELSDSERAAEFASFITKNSITTESAAAITKNLTLDAGYSKYNLSDNNVSINWTSTNAAINPQTGAVTQGNRNESGTLTATITAGEETVSKDFYFTVPMKNTANLAPSNNLFAELDFEDKENNSTETVVRNDDNTYNAWLGENVTMKYVNNVRSGSTVAELKSTTGEYVSRRASWLAGQTHRFITHCDIMFPANGIYRFVISGNGITAEAQFKLDESNSKLSLNYRKQGSMYHEFPLPEAIETNKWFSLDIDMNTMSRSYVVYINGEAVGSIPSEMGNTNQIGNGSYRYVYFYMPVGGTMYIDNFNVRTDSDADRIKANAAVNAALVTYGFENNLLEANEAVVTGFETLPTAGPDNGATYGGTYTANNQYTAALPPYSFTGGAAMTWRVNGQSKTGAYTPAAAGTTTFEVTATSGAVTETATFTRKTAPVAIGTVTYNQNNDLTSINLSGSLSGKNVFVAGYKDGALEFAEIYNAGETVTLNPALTIAEGVDVRVFVMDKLSLKPYAFSK